MPGKNKKDSKKNRSKSFFLWLFIREYLAVASEMKLIQITNIC